MRRFILLLALVGIVGCSSAPTGPEPPGDKPECDCICRQTTKGLECRYSAALDTAHGRKP